MKCHEPATISHRLNAILVNDIVLMSLIQKSQTLFKCESEGGERKLSPLNVKTKCNARREFSTQIRQRYQ